MKVRHTTEKICCLEVLTAIVLKIKTCSSTNDITSKIRPGTYKTIFSHLPKVSARPLTPSEPSSAPKSLMLTERDHRKVRLCSGIDWLCLDLHVVLKNSSITSIKIYKETYVRPFQDTYNTFILSSCSFMMIDVLHTYKVLYFLTNLTKTHS